MNDNLSIAVHAFVYHTEGLFSKSVVKILIQWNYVSTSINPKRHNEKYIYFTLSYRRSLEYSDCIPEDGIRILTPDKSDPLGLTLNYIWSWDSISED